MLLNIHKIVLGLAVTFQFIFWSPAQALVAPELEWKTLVTNHFEIIYETKHQGIAEEAARSAERAHLLLTPFLKAPTSKTVIWIYDHTDSPNGMATPLPRNTIVLYPVLPTSMDSIGHYDSWSQKLIIHEYAHILNMDPAGSFWSPFRVVFGSIIRPNILLPTWYLEGLAVEIETHFSKFGRLRSPYFNALIRAMVEDNRWFEDSLALANETSVATWPYGLRPYFWGGLMMHEISDRRNVESLGELNERYGSRFPFFINAPLKDLLGVNYQQLFKEMRTSYDKKAREQLKNIQSYSRQDKALQARRHTELGVDIQNPTISPDGLKLAYIQVNADRDYIIQLLTRNSTDVNFNFAEPKKVFSGKGITRLSFWPDSKSIVFDAIDVDAVYDNFSDIWRYHIEEKEKDRLTHQARAIQPQISRDGQRILYVRTSAHQNQLAILKDGQTEILYTPPALHRLSYPGFLNDNEVIFAERNLEGREGLKVISLSSRNIRSVLPQFKIAQNPVVTSKGVLFLSSDSGVPNLYLSTPSLSGARPVTNSTTMVNSGIEDRAKNELIFTQLTGTGVQLHSQTVPVENYRLPATANLISEPKTKWQEPIVRPNAVKEDYQPMSYLLPQYWIPLFGLIPDGVFVSAFTSGSDPLGKHAYYLAGNYDSVAGKVGFNAQYNWALGDGYLSPAGGIDQRYFYTFNVLTTNSYADLQYNWLPTRKNKDWLVAGRFSKVMSEVQDDKTYEYAGPGALISYSTVSQKPTEISPMRGVAASVDYQYYLNSWGNVQFPRTRMNFTTYVPWLLPKRHVLALSFDGYVSPRNRSVFLGSTAGGPYSLTFLSAKSLNIRGYPVNEFMGWNMASGSMEYRFPVSDRETDLGLFPAMLKRWHGAVFLDTLTAEGFYYAKDVRRARSIGMGNMFYGVGLESRWDVTLAYHLGAMIRLGVFYGLNENAYGGLSPFVSLTLPEF